MSGVKTTAAVARLLICLVLLAPFGSAHAEDPATPASGASATLTPDTVKARLEEVKATTELDETSKGSLTELYRKTLSSLEQERASSDASAAFSKARKTAPEEARAVREALEKLEQESPTVTLNVSEDTPVAKVEQELLNEKANQAAVDAKLDELEKQLAMEAERPAAIRQRLSEARQSHEQSDSQLKQATPAGELPFLTEARQWSLTAQLRALSTELKMLDQELLSQPMRIELMQAQRDRTERSHNRLATRLSMLEELLGQQRRKEAEQAKLEAEVAKAEMVGKHPLIRQLAEQNAALTDHLTRVSAELEKVSTGDESAYSSAKRIEEELRSTKKKLEVAGLSQVLGRVLLEQRRLLPELGSIRKQTQAREDLIAAAALDQIQDKEELKRLRNLSDYIEQLTSGLEPEQAAQIQPDLEGLAKKRRDLLGKAASLDEAYLRSLGDLEFAQNRLIDAIETYDAFLAERLLWIRSAPPPNLAMLLQLPEQVYELLAPGHWLNVGNILFTQLTQSPLLVLVLLVFAVLLAKYIRMQKLLLESGKKLVKVSTDRFSYTLQALALTLLLAAPWPLLFAVSGWQLSASLETTAFTRALSHAVMVLSPAFFFLKAFRVMCLPGGLAEAHFRWPAASTRALRQQLRILMLTFLPAGLVAITTINAGSPEFGGGLGRVAFVVLVISLSYFFYRLFGPRQATLGEFLQRYPSSALARFRLLWLVLALLLPAFLVILAISGYLYTAGTLTGSLVDTLWLVLGFIVIHQLMVRWLQMTRRKLDLEAALERRRAALAAADSEKDAGEAAQEAQLQEEEPEVDLIALNQESRKLLNTAIVFSAVVGLWGIWSDVLPAFGFLDQVSLWHQTQVVEGAQQLIPVTLADLVLAILIGVVTVIATRSFPALLEIILLKRSSVSPGGRYAATSLSRYSIAAIGTLLALGIVGASWSQVQWLAAALSVGIGFGLQEIVANFISGIIILFERPIRVGDVVTVGDTDGTVSRIQIRATTIRNWDRQELLVPNKEFITGRLLNWSLSDETTRIKIPVGVAYGSDVQKAMSLMDEAARENDKVLEEPPHSIVFDCFGDNSLNLVLRCFVATQDARMQTITRLHEAINQKFNDAGVVISFPQRDVHLDTSQPLDIRLRHDDGDKSPG
jgi:potassium efflux system protein